MRSVPSISIRKTAASEASAQTTDEKHCADRLAPYRRRLLVRPRLYVALALIRFANVPVKLAFRLARLGVLDRSTLRFLLQLGRIFRQLSWDLWASTRIQRR